MNRKKVKRALRNVDERLENHSCYFNVIGLYVFFLHKSIFYPPFTFFLVNILKEFLNKFVCAVRIAFNWRVGNWINEKGPRI